MNDISESYRMLDLEPGATLEEVKRSYRELVKVWHPDRFRGDARLQAKAEEKLKRINYAYERLCAEVRTKAPEPSPPKPPASSGPKASFPHPPKPQPRQANPSSGPAQAQPQRPAAGVGKSGNFAQLFRQPWAIVGSTVVLAAAICGVLWSLNRETMSSEATRALRAANRGDADAQFSLGKMYSGGRGVVKNNAKAVEWFLKAAAQEHAPAQLAVGASYYSGSELPKDDSKAVEWYRKAADNGNADGQYALGSHYSSGTGVPLNAVESRKWLQKAAEQGHVQAQELLAQDDKIKKLEEDSAKAGKIIAAAAERAEQDLKRAIDDFVKLKTDEEPLRHLSTDERPKNGTVLVERFKSEGKLAVENGLSEDAYVKLVAHGKLVTALYVRGQEQFTYKSVSNGSYSVLFCTGYGWDAKTRRFTRGRQASRYDVPLEFWTWWKKDSSGGRIVYDAITLTLHKVSAGNAKTSSVGLDEFDRY